LIADGNDRKDVMIRQIREVIAEDNRKDTIETSSVNSRPGVVPATVL
jgi:hypothetical protein